MSNSKDSFDELHFSRQLDHVSSSRIEGACCIVYAEADAVTHAHQSQYSLILTFHLAMTVPKNTFYCIFSPQRTLNQINCISATIVQNTKQREYLAAHVLQS